MRLVGLVYCACDFCMLLLYLRYLVGLFVLILWRFEFDGCFGAFVTTGVGWWFDSSFRFGVVV